MLQFFPDKSNYSRKVGSSIFEKKGVALVWMSVGNSYFKKDIIKEILNITTREFSKVIVLAPFEPAIYTYLALGNEEKKAIKKARLNSNRLKNHVRSILEDMPTSNKKKVTIMDWDEDIAKTAEYQKSLQEIKELYKDCRKFKHDARETTKEVLSSKGLTQENEIKAINQGVNYLIEELAFVLSSTTILNVQNIVYLYHRPWEIYENLISGSYDKKKRNNTGFLLLKPSE